MVALGAVATAVIINSGDSATTKATVGAPVGAPAPRTVVSTTPRTTAPPSTSPSPPPSTTAGPNLSAPPLAPETVTTVTIPSAAPTRMPTAAPQQPLSPPSAAPSPRTVVYSVTGTKQLLDIVNVVYTDERGFPVTEFNVALPWTKMVVLNPGVQTESVVATSIYSRLNCVIVNAQGQPVVASTSNSILATCTR
ncbi:threonine AND proline RICH protein [Mycobacterium attenuatum]|uniref:threonine AND proline RICH protein n=1 Tax=Mycobacterium attenuatum TaxID=2341086 RepID=UPI000F026768|nr:threonine AND proline RICH protein [Mycobacterium attenuatum]